MTPAFEVNFDGLVGPTHSYAGLSRGNLASQQHRQQVSYPRDAALQGLAKMKLLTDMGVKQAILPPQERPDLPTLRRLGFTGSDAQILQKAAAEAPLLLAACSSASAMWAANAATVSPSPDAADNRVHVTAANLISQFHRSLETETTARLLRTVFPDQSHFAHHPPLPSAGAFADEGAANHTRLCTDYASAGIELFVFGRSSLDGTMSVPTKFPARQTQEASEAIARLHQLHPNATIFAQQNPTAIDAGAFHNDVVAVGNLDLLLCHSQAFLDGTAMLEQLRSQFAKTTGDELAIIEINQNELPLTDAISSYLFNSQLVRRDDGTIVLIAPIECQELPSARAVLQSLPDRSGHRIASIQFVDVRQSMHNGGGPACLRLRVVLTQAQLQAVHPHVFLTDALYGDLTAWITKHYRADLHPRDLADPQLLDESRRALDELTQLLKIGPLYSFQR